MKAQARTFGTPKTFLPAFVIFACVFLGATLISCIDTKGIAICTLSGDADFIATGENVVNPRIELNAANSHRSLAIWIREGDHILARWDRVNVYLTKKMAECHFETVTSFNENCRICDLCGGNDPQLCMLSLPGYSSTQPGDPTLVPLKVRRGLSSDGELIVDEQIAPTASCTGPPRELAPTETSTIELFKPRAACERPDMQSLPIASAQIHVIKNGTNNSEFAKFELSKHEETKPANCGSSTRPCNTIWYRWTMPNNEIWSDNFSPNLHVGIVRINKYMKDPNSGALTFIEEVRPSRIVLRTGFVEGQSALDQSHNLALDGNRCYAVPQALISGDQPFVDFSECHVGSPDLPNFGDPQTLMVTPTNFDDFDPTTSNDRPTWFVEFNDVGTEAAPAPVLGENQVLLIEFGISANA